MIRPTGHRVVLKPINTFEKREDDSKSLIVIPKDFTAREEKGTTMGVVVSMGPSAFDVFNGDPWCEVGDTVYFRQYEGVNISYGEDERYILVNDEDIIGVEED